MSEPSRFPPLTGWECMNCGYRFRESDPEETNCCGAPAPRLNPSLRRRIASAPMKEGAAPMPETPTLEDRAAEVVELLTEAKARCKAEERPGTLHGAKESYEQGFLAGVVDTCDQVFALLLPVAASRTERNPRA